MMTKLQRWHFVSSFFYHGKMSQHARGLLRAVNWRLTGVLWYSEFGIRA